MPLYNAYPECQPKKPSWFKSWFMPATAQQGTVISWAGTDGQSYNTSHVHYSNKILSTVDSGKADPALLAITPRYQVIKDTSSGDCYLFPADNAQIMSHIDPNFRKVLNPIPPPTAPGHIGGLSRVTPPPPSRQ